MGLRERKIAAATAMLHARFFGLLASCVQPGRQTHPSAADTVSVAHPLTRWACTAHPADLRDVMDVDEQDKFVK